MVLLDMIVYFCSDIYFQVGFILLEVPVEQILTGGTNLSTERGFLYFETSAGGSVSVISLSTQGDILHRKHSQVGDAGQGRDGGKRMQIVKMGDIYEKKVPTEI